MRWMHQLVAPCWALAVCTLLSRQAPAQCSDGCCDGRRAAFQGPKTFAGDANQYQGGRYGPPGANRHSPSSESSGEGHNPLDRGYPGGRSPGGPPFGPMGRQPGFGPPRAPRRMPRSGPTGPMTPPGEMSRSEMAGPQTGPAQMGAPWMVPRARGGRPYGDSDAAMGGHGRGYRPPPRLTPGLGRW
jgi:hypothetical protein